MSINSIENRISQTKNEIENIENGNLNTSIGLRLQMWKAGLYIIRDHFITGVGEGHMKLKSELSSKGIISKNASILSHYHNQIINDTVKYGIVGLVLLIASFILPINLLFKNNNLYTNLGYILIVHYAITCMTDVPLHNAQTHAFYFCLIFILTYSFPPKNKLLLSSS
ncbi:hypothetical protein VcTj87_08300 [Vibrio comitans]